MDTILLAKASVGENFKSLEIRLCMSNDPTRIPE